MENHYAPLPIHFHLIIALPNKCNQIFGLMHDICKANFLGDHHIDNCHSATFLRMFTVLQILTPLEMGKKPKALFRFLALYLFREKVLQSKNVFVFGLWCINGNWQLFLSFTMCEFRTISKAFWSFFLAIKWPNFRPKVLVWNFTVGKFKTISYLSLTFSANFRTNLIS